MSAALAQYSATSRLEARLKASRLEARLEASRLEGRQEASRSEGRLATSRLEARSTSRHEALLAATILPFAEAAHRPAAPQLLHFAQDGGIYEEGDTAICYYKVVSGVVRTCRFSLDGRRHIDAFYMPGDVFGFELGTAHAFSAEAVTDCSLLPCRRRGVEDTVAQDGMAAMQLYAYAMNQLTRARAHSQLLGRCSAAQRLASFLLELSAGDKGMTIELAMTRQDIADYLGLTIETVSRTLAQLEKSGVISLLAARRDCREEPRGARENERLKGFYTCNVIVYHLPRSRRMGHAQDCFRVGPGPGCRGGAGANTGTARAACRGAGEPVRQCDGAGRRPLCAGDRHRGRPQYRPA